MAEYITDGTVIKVEQTVIQGDPSSVGALNDLTDVVITNPTTDQVLKYNGSNWVNGTVAGGGDMLASQYDPQNIAGDAFDTDNHTSGVNNKVFTAAEQTKLAGIGSGADVSGPASSTDNALVRFDGTTGKVVQNSVATLTDAGELTANSFKVGNTFLENGVVSHAGNLNLNATQGELRLSAVGGVTIDTDSDNSDVISDFIVTTNGGLTELMRLTDEGVLTTSTSLGTSQTTLSDNTLFSQGALAVTADGSMTFKTDANNNGTDDDFVWQTDVSTELMRLTDGGTLSLAVAGCFFDSTGFTKTSGGVLNINSNNGNMNLTSVGGFTFDSDSDNSDTVSDFIFTTNGGLTELAKITDEGRFSSLSLLINGTTLVDGILDEDNMISNSATALATQQSIKAYVDANAGTDADAVHVNVAGEINGITEKLSPTTGDFLIIEDGADAFNKKKVNISNLPTGGGGEANTASNAGSGVGVFKQKTGVNLEFNELLSVEPTLLSISLNGATNNIEFQPSTTPAYDYVTLTPQSAPSHSEGIIAYDSATKSFIAFNDISAVTLNIGEETWIRVINNTGSTITNGTVCYLSGISGSLPTAGLADATDKNKSVATLGFATHDILNGAEGLITSGGVVRDLDTSGCTPGSILYLSTTPGQFTETEPNSPAYSIKLGNCGVSNVSTGTIFAHVTAGDNRKGTQAVYNGMVLEDHTTNVTSDGTTVSVTLEKTGGGDLSLYFDGEFTVFDATPTASVSITAGSDSSPTLNYVYIPKSTNSLTNSTVGFPTTEQYVPVAVVYCQSAASVQTDGPLKWHAWTDHITEVNGQGHISHINEWIRSQHSTWLSGSAVTPVAGTNQFDIQVASGKMLQLHEHTTSTFDTSVSDDIYIVNDNATAFKKVGDLTGELTDAVGGSLSGRYYSVVIWVTGSEGVADDKLFCNLPTGSYSSASDAINDPSSYAVYDIPQEFKGVGILLARVVVRHQTLAGGTWTLEDNLDLRGAIPGLAVGGSSSGAGSEFSDNLFRIQNVTDNTKEVAFDASGITTATTRTLTVQDKDYTIADQADVALNTTHRSSDGTDHSDVVLNNSHRASSANPHSTSLANIGSGTLADLNSALTDATVVGRNTTDTLTNKTLTNPILTLTNSAGASPTTLGDLRLDTTDNLLVFGDGTNTRHLSDIDTIVVPCSDETSDLTTGTAKVTFRLPNYATTLVAVRASVNTAPTGSGITVDVNEGGTSVLSTKITIDATEKDSVDATTQPVISDSSLAARAEITVDIDAVGSTVAGAGLKLEMDIRRA